MIRFRTRLAIPALALALVACAEKPLGQPFDGSADEPHLDAAARQKASPEKPKSQKPVRTIRRGAVSSISLEPFFALQQSGKALVFDARAGFFYHLGHIPGAIHLPKQNCDKLIRERETEIKAALAAGKTIVVYCTSRNCPDAMTVANHLSGFGYPAAVFAGGWDAWKNADLPSE
jgi:rhodanese-related sulfurtransferase